MCKSLCTCIIIEILNSIKFCALLVKRVREELACVNRMCAMHGLYIDLCVLQELCLSQLPIPPGSGGLWLEGCGLQNEGNISYMTVSFGR